MKTFLILILLLFAISFTSVAQPTASPSATTKPAFIGLFVNDLDKMKQWYETELGFNVLQFTKVSPQLGFAMLEWNGLWIEMIQHPKTVTKKDFKSTFPEAKNMEGFFKLGFYTDDIDALEKKFKTAGVPFVYNLMTNNNFPMKLFIVEDPEGNWLQFYHTPRQTFPVIK